MLSHNPGCWLVNINKFITGNMILILGLVLKYHIFVTYRKHLSPGYLSYGSTFLRYASFPSYQNNKTKQNK